MWARNGYAFCLECVTELGMFLDCSLPPTEGLGARCSVCEGIHRPLVSARPGILLCLECIAQAVTTLNDLLPPRDLFSWEPPPDWPPKKSIPLTPAMMVEAFEHPAIDPLWRTVLRRRYGLDGPLTPRDVLHREYFPHLYEREFARQLQSWVSFALHAYRTDHPDSQD